MLAAAGHEEATVIGEMDLSTIQSTRHAILRILRFILVALLCLWFDQGRTFAGRTSRWRCRGEETSTDWLTFWSMTRWNRALSCAARCHQCNTDWLTKTYERFQTSHGGHVHRTLGIFLCLRVSVQKIYHRDDSSPMSTTCFWDVLYRKNSLSLGKTLNCTL